MNEEQTKRLADAAEAVLSASDSLDDARETLADRRYESEQERERLQAIQQSVNKIDQCAKRAEEALRKGVVAAATRGGPSAYPRYREGISAAREARTLAKSAPDQDGTLARRQRAEEAIGKLQAAVTIAASFVFGE